MRRLIHITNRDHALLLSAAIANCTPKQAAARFGADTTATGIGV
jgi:hypothetical protein